MGKAIRETGPDSFPTPTNHLLGRSFFATSSNYGTASDVPVSILRILDRAFPPTPARYVQALASLDKTRFNWRFSCLRQGFRLGHTGGTQTKELNMKKHLIAATALVVTLVGCSRSSTDGMGSSGSSESGSSSAPLPLPARSSSPGSDTNNIISTNEISGAAASSSSASEINAPPQPAQPQPEAQQPLPQPQPEQQAQPQQSQDQSAPPSTTP